MTLPSDITLPVRSDDQEAEGSDLNQYLNELTVALQDMYENVVSVVNGQYTLNREATSLLDDRRDQWTPTLIGSTPGTGFTYTHQIGASLRQGLLVDLWFDVGWTASGGATGNLYLDLPYQVANSEEKPYVGVCQPSAIAFTGGTGLVINAIPDTFRGEFWNVGTGFTTANQSVVASGQIIGHIRYIGQANED